MTAKHTKQIQLVAIMLALVFMGFMGTKLWNLTSDRIDKDNAKLQLRKDNGGAIPGKELLGSDGRVYQIITFKNEPGIVCLSYTGMKSFTCYPKKISVVFKGQSI